MRFTELRGFSPRQHGAHWGIASQMWRARKPTERYPCGSTDDMMARGLPPRSQCQVAPSDAPAAALEEVAVDAGEENKEPLAGQLRVCTLNLGGRNTNSFEFLMAGHAASRRTDDHACQTYLPFAQVTAARWAASGSGGSRLPSAPSQSTRRLTSPACVRPSTMWSHWWGLSQATARST